GIGSRAILYRAVEPSGLGKNDILHSPKLVEQGKTGSWPMDSKYALCLAVHLLPLCNPALTIVNFPSFLKVSESFFIVFSISLKEAFCESELTESFSHATKIALATKNSGHDNRFNFHVF